MSCTARECTWSLLHWRVSVPDPISSGERVNLTQQHWSPSKWKLCSSQSPKLIRECNLILTPKYSSVEISCEAKNLSSRNCESNVFAALYGRTLLQMAALKHLKSQLFTHIDHLLLFKAFSPNIRLRLYVSQIQIPVEPGRELNCYKSPVCSSTTLRPPTISIRSGTARLVDRASNYQRLLQKLMISHRRNSGNIS